VGELDQLFSRSRREIEAQAAELVDNETGRHFITLAAELLAALRLWAQRQYRSDQAVRELLEAVDPVTLREIAAELQAANDPDTPPPMPSPGWRSCPPDTCRRSRRTPGEHCDLKSAVTPASSARLEDVVLGASAPGRLGIVGEEPDRAGGDPDMAP
jgi:hypothetical protein